MAAPPRVLDELVQHVAAVSASREAAATAAGPSSAVQTWLREAPQADASFASLRLVARLRGDVAQLAAQARGATPAAAGGGDAEMAPSDVVDVVARVRRSGQWDELVGVWKQRVQEELDGGRAISPLADEGEEAKRHVASSASFGDVSFGSLPSMDALGAAARAVLADDGGGAEELEAALALLLAFPPADMLAADEWHAAAAALRLGLLRADAACARLTRPRSMSLVRQGKGADAVGDERAMEADAERAAFLRLHTVLFADAAPPQAVDLLSNIAACLHQVADRSEKAPASNPWLVRLVKVWQSMLAAMPSMWTLLPATCMSQLAETTRDALSAAATAQTMAQVDPRASWFSRWLISAPKRAAVLAVFTNGRPLTAWTTHVTERRRDNAYMVHHSIHMLGAMLLYHEGRSLLGDAQLQRMLAALAKLVVDVPPPSSKTEERAHMAIVSGARNTLVSVLNRMAARNGSLDVDDGVVDVLRRPWLAFMRKTPAKGGLPTRLSPLQDHVLLAATAVLHCIAEHDGGKTTQLIADFQHVLLASLAARPPLVAHGSLVSTHVFRGIVDAAEALLAHGSLGPAFVGASGDLLARLRVIFAHHQQSSKNEEIEDGRMQSLLGRFLLVPQGVVALDASMLLSAALEHACRGVEAELESCARIPHAVHTVVANVVLHCDEGVLLLLQHCPALLTVLHRRAVEDENALDEADDLAPNSGALDLLGLVLASPSFLAYVSATGKHELALALASASATATVRHANAPSDVLCMPLLAALLLPPESRAELDEFNGKRRNEYGWGRLLHNELLQETTVDEQSGSRLLIQSPSSQLRHALLVHFSRLGGHGERQCASFDLDRFVSVPLEYDYRADAAPPSVAPPATDDDADCADLIALLALPVDADFLSKAKAAVGTHLAASFGGPASKRTKVLARLVLKLALGKRGTAKPAAGHRELMALFADYASSLGTTSSASDVAAFVGTYGAPGPAFDWFAGALFLLHAFVGSDGDADPPAADPIRPAPPTAAAVASVHQLVRAEERALGRAFGDAHATSLQQLQISQRLRHFAVNSLAFPALVEYLALVVTHDEAVVHAFHASLVLATPASATLFFALTQPPEWDAAAENLFANAGRLAQA